MCRTAGAPGLTEVLLEECHADSIYDEGDDLRQDHVYVPDRIVRRDRTRMVLSDDAQHVVISSATMMSSLRIRAVNEIATMFRNSFSNNTSDMIMMAAPARTVLDANEPRKCSATHLGIRKSSAT